jgi:hypothetical protein
VLHGVLSELHDGLGEPLTIRLDDADSRAVEAPITAR